MSTCSRSCSPSVTPSGACERRHLRGRRRGSCRRAVGLSAVDRCVRRLRPGPQAAVADVLAEAREEDGRADCCRPGRRGGCRGFVRLPAGRPSRGGRRGGHLGHPAADRSGLASPGASAGHRRARRLVAVSRIPARGAAGPGRRPRPGGTAACPVRGGGGVGAGADWRAELGYPGPGGRAGPRRVRGAVSGRRGVAPERSGPGAPASTSPCCAAAPAAVVAAVATWVDGRIEAAAPGAVGSTPGALVRSGLGCRRPRRVSSVGVAGGREAGARRGRDCGRRSPPAPA